jgi:hypothetical protein
MFPTLLHLASTLVKVLDNAETFEVQSPCSRSSVLREIPPVVVDIPGTHLMDNKVYSAIEFELYLGSIFALQPSIAQYSTTAMESYKAYYTSCSCRSVHCRPRSSDRMVGVICQSLGSQDTQRGPGYVSITIPPVNRNQIAFYEPELLICGNLFLIIYAEQSRD